MECTRGSRRGKPRLATQTLPGSSGLHTSCKQHAPAHHVLDAHPVRDVPACHTLVASAPTSHGISVSGRILIDWEDLQKSDGSTCDAVPQWPHWLSCQQSTPVQRHGSHCLPPELASGCARRLCYVLDVIYDKRPVQRFWFLEVVARMPYFSYISMLHLYESLGWWRAGAALRKVDMTRHTPRARHTLP